MGEPTWNLARKLGYSPEECSRGLETARPYARRLNVLDGLHGITVVDDCYNANPASMEAALVTLGTLVPEGGRAVAVLGDMLELGPLSEEAHREVGEAIAQQPPDLLVTVGERAAWIARAAVAGGMPEERVLVASTGIITVAMTRIRKNSAEPSGRLGRGRSSIKVQTCQRARLGRSHL